MLISNLVDNISLGLGGLCQIETGSSSKKLKKLLLDDDIIKGETIKGTGVTYFDKLWYKWIM
jgi:hypothetical protein